MRDHDDQLFVGYLADKIHNLNAGGGIERARRLVGEQDFGLVDQRSRNRHALALSARKLIGALVVLPRQSHAVESLFRTFDALGFTYARDCQRELDVAQHRLVRYQVVALENEAYAVVAVHVPIAVAELAGADAVYAHVARSVLVESADDVEHRGLAASAGTEYRHELVFAEIQRHALERVYYRVRYFVIFRNSG